ncbi:MAG: rod shape-determining protein MreC [Clostridia bacterium]|nr:rod shape-determining protein MreC [Clostridia bacterium]
MKGTANKKTIAITIVAVIVLGLLALITAGDRALTWMESTIGVIVTPIQGFVFQVSDGIVDFFESLFNTTDADVENEQLKARIATLEQMLSDYEDTKAENERLKELLDFASTFENVEYVTGQVIGKGQSIWFDTITLNVGKNKGVDVNMPVIAAEGLVGRVTEVGATWCKVVSVIDSTVNISVMVERTRDIGVARGITTIGADDAQLELMYLPTGNDLVPGDKIITSGMGSDMPKAIPVGVVVEVLRAEEDVSKRNAIIEPYVDFLHLEEVMIIIGSGEAE